MYKLLISDKNIWNYTTVCKLSVLDKNRQTKTGVLRLTNKEKYDRTLYNHNKYHIVQTIFLTLQIYLQTSPQNLVEMYIGQNILRLMLHIDKYFQHWSVYRGGI